MTPPGWFSLVLVMVMCAAVVWSRTDQEDEEDSVNVISVENMDALLRLRMVTELGLDVFGNRSEEGARFRRWAPRSRPPQPEAQVEPLCSRPGCLCTPVGGRFLNVTCDLQSLEVLDLARGALPPNALHLHVANVRQLRVLPRAFADHPVFTEASFRGVGSLHIHREAFYNLTASIFYLNIQECGLVTLEELSYHTPRTPLDATIQDCDRVVLQSHAFSWLLQLHISHVPSLQAVKNSFSSRLTSVHEPATNITFQNVSMSTIPNGTFSLSARVILFAECTIGRVMSGAFNAIQYSTVHFRDTSVQRFDTEAFSQSTLVREMALLRVTVDHVAAHVLSAVTNLTIHGCRIGEVTSGAFTVKAAAVELSDTRFGRTRRHAFRINDWNRVVVDGNRFEHLEAESFALPFHNLSTVAKYEFAFTNNEVVRPEPATLAFLPADPGVEVSIHGNRFDNPCHCHLPAWLRDVAPPRGRVLYETSFCVVNEVLARCFNLEKGFMKMTNFTEGLCNNVDKLVCEEAKRTYHSEVLSELDLESTERRVLAVIFLGVVCSVSIMLLILSAIWLRRKGLCRAPRGILSRLFAGTSLVATASISRVNIHEYAEIQNQINGQTVLTLEEPDDEELIPCEDKATQTLPEELTQELLQTLREKLDDPDNYNEARDMIEHLYDLIKVEENCNNNTPSPRASFGFEEEEEDPGGNLYDVIQPRRTVRCKRRKETVSQGTRAPSPDKLQPVNYTAPRAKTPALISEYLEPRDRRSHEYCELPVAGGMPDVVALPPHGSMQHRPLPCRPDQPQPGPSQP